MSGRAVERLATAVGEAVQNPRLDVAPVARRCVLLALAVAGCARGRVDIMGDATIMGTAEGIFPDFDVVQIVEEDPVKPTFDGDQPTDDVRVSDTPTVDASGPCGTGGLACCASSRCGAQYACMSGVCVEHPTCGMYNQPCCGTAACGAGLTCASGRCSGTAACGGSGQTCCASGVICRPGLACSAGACAPCGGPGQVCCTAAPMCNPAYGCASGVCRPAV